MVQWIVYIVFGGFGVVLIWVGATQAIQQQRMLAAAQPVPATIIKSEVLKSTSSDTDARVGRDNSTHSYRPDVRFCYRIGGVDYESDMIYPTIIVQGFASKDSASEVLLPYPQGAEVTAHVDPAHPDKAFLIAERSSLPLVFALVGLVLQPLAWFGSKLV